jgi:hypothetical protein
MKLGPMSFFFLKLDGTFGHSIGMHGKFYQEIKEGEEWAIYIKKQNINMHASNANIVAHFSCV